MPPSRGAEEATADDGRAGARSVLGNVASLFGVRTVERATSFIVYALVARYLGAEGLGRLTLAVSILYLFDKFVLFGLHTLVTREVAGDPGSARRYFVHAVAVVLLAALVAQGIGLAFVGIAGYDPETSRTIQILLLALLPFTSAQVIEAVFIGWEKSKYAAYVSAPVNVLQTGVAFVLLWQGLGVDAVVWSIVGAHLAIFLIQFVILLARMPKEGVDFEIREAFGMVRSALPFLGIQSVNGVKSTANVLIISWLLGERAVGIYGAANQLLVPLDLISNSTARGVFPLMVRRFQQGVEAMRSATTRILEVMAAISLPAVTGLFLLAPSILVTLFGRTEFLESVAVIRIMVLVPLSVAFTSLLGQVLWASGRERDAFRISLINAIVKVVAALVLVSAFGIVGAAIAALIVGVINVVQHYVPASRIVAPLRPVSFIWRPLLASIAMLGILLLTDHLHVLLRVGLGAASYLVLFALLLVISEGGVRPLRKKAEALGII